MHRILSEEEIAAAKRHPAAKAWRQSVNANGERVFSNRILGLEIIEELPTEEKQSDTDDVYFIQESFASQ
ncbi:hypothetical protein [uncultured Alistipes sp.]|uniref:hypothetical protein n=1 Tax=uncultured Alistipes sp. TaxID=538949 RepID=UPI002607D2B0|nr:hypothetical protein [uncultured Alistipes sp.]